MKDKPDSKPVNEEAKEKAPGKTGPKPKKLTEGSIMGIPIGRGDNKAIVPPDDVYELASIGCTNAEIAGFYGVNQDTLQRNFKSELAKGREHSKIRLRRAMLNNAIQNNNAAVQIFLAKNMLGMSDQGQTDSEDKAPLPWNDED